MIQRGKIQVGDTILEAEIDVSPTINVTIDWKFSQNGSRIQPVFTIIDPNKTVEGSIARPITDEGRLLK